MKPLPPIDDILAALLQNVMYIEKHMLKNGHVENILVLEDLSGVNLATVPFF